MAVPIKTGRGAYSLKNAADAVREPGATVLTLALERDDGIERVAFKCRITDAFLGGAIEPIDTDMLVARLAPWIEREFEMTREAALKSIRSERKLLELVFDTTNRGGL